MNSKFVGRDNKWLLQRVIPYSKMKRFLIFGK